MERIFDLFSENQEFLHNKGFIRLAFSSHFQAQKLIQGNYELRD